MVFHSVVMVCMCDVDVFCSAFLSVYSFTMFFNFLAAFAMLVKGAEPIHDGQTFGISILYLVANVPLSFLGWYRPCYNALK